MYTELNAWTRKRSKDYLMEGDFGIKPTGSLKSYTAYYYILFTEKYALWVSLRYLTYHHPYIYYIKSKVNWMFENPDISYMMISIMISSIIFTLGIWVLRKVLTRFNQFFTYTHTIIRKEFSLNYWCAFDNFKIWDVII